MWLRSASVAKLRQTADRQRALRIDDISRDTRIAPRFLEAIETEDYSSLPGLIFTRNFVRQYAADAETGSRSAAGRIAQTGRIDRAAADSARAPARPIVVPAGSSDPRICHRYCRPVLLRARRRSAHTWRRITTPFGIVARESRPAAVQAASRAPSARTDNHGVALPLPVRRMFLGQPRTGLDTVGHAPGPTCRKRLPASAPVQVSLTAPCSRAWVQVSADGKTTFIGTLQPNETKEFPPPSR